MLTTNQRFAYYSTIPVLIIQITLLALGTYAMFAQSPRRQGHRDLEKTQGHQLQDVGNLRQLSFETKHDGSPGGVYPDNQRILDGRSRM